MKRQELKEILKLLQRSKQISDAANSATQLLEGLLSAEEELIVDSVDIQLSKAKKRKAEDSDRDGDPFKRAVKRLLLDASTARSGPSVGSEASPASAQSLPGASPSIPISSLLRQASGVFGDSRDPLYPPPFQPDLDLFLDGSKTYTQTARGMPPSLDATSADLSHRTCQT